MEGVAAEPPGLGMVPDAKRIGQQQRVLGDRGTERWLAMGLNAASLLVEGTLGRNNA